MKNIIKKIFSYVAEHDTAWAFLEVTLLRAADYAKIARRMCTPSEVNTLKSEFISRFCSSWSVKHGPFKGMRYPECKSAGSTLIPKLLGSYENELHSIVSDICHNRYDTIIDIGCAEGYYAVGFAMRMQNVKVYAYDTDSEAMRLCRAMARLNNVDDRLIFGGACEPTTICSLPLGEKALIISDCEGYELRLFDERVVGLLAAHDVLVEVHDFVDIHISRVLQDAFAKTHFIQKIKSIDDIEKAHIYNYPELEGYDLPSRRELVAECRPAIMEWFYMTAKARN